MDLNLTNLDIGCSNDGQYYQFGPTGITTTKLRFSPVITIIIYIIYLLPFCFGTFGNISVCLIFFQQKKLRSITNTFLMNLCINDLIVLCVSIPMTLSHALLEHWIFGAFLCKIVNFTPTVTALVSTFTVAIIAVERWFFIVNRRKFDRRLTILILILLWIGSILIALPEFISREIEEFNPETYHQQWLDGNASLASKANNGTNISNDYHMIKPPCKTKKIYYCIVKPNVLMRIFSYIVITVQYLVPFVFVSVSCYSISRFLKRRMRRMHAYQTYHRPTKNAPKLSQKESSNATEETTVQELTSCDDLSTTINLHDIKSTHFLSRFRQSLQNRENPVNVVDQQHITRCQSHTERRFHRSRKLLICVAALFTFSWLPLTIVQIYVEHDRTFLDTGDGANFAYGYLILCYLISSLPAWINPIIYNYINRSFRREFYSLYSCCFKASSATSRKELTSNEPKRHRPETASHIDGASVHLSSRLTIKHGTQVVSFADETTVMMHRQS